MYRLFFLIASFSFSAVSHGDETTTYHSQDEKSIEQAVGYRKTNQSLSRYLAYRDIPALISQYAKGRKALDNGVGPGASTQFLLDQGFDVTGVDVSQEMLAQAMKNCY